MKLAPFLLDEWLAQKDLPGSPIKFDLASSTGPSWTLRELLALEGDEGCDRLLDGRLYYTPTAGSPELREAIAGLEGVEPEHVQVVTGASEALAILFWLAAEAGANVVLPEPGYPTNAAFAESFGLQIRQYRLRRESGFRIDCDEIRALVDRDTRFVLVNTPHNPTGSVLSDAEMDSLHDLCAERGVPFICDQVYHPIYHGAETRSAARLRHATVLGDFSKALCLSGLRTGWIVERDPERRALYRNARSHLSISNTVLGEHLATLALRHSETIYGRVREVTERNLALLDPVMKELQDVLGWVRPGGGMTALPWLTSQADAREFCCRLASRGVLVAPGDCFGRPEYFRLGFGSTRDRFGAAIGRFADLVRSEARQLSIV